MNAMASLNTTVASRSDSNACTKACSALERWSPDTGQATSRHFESSQERQDDAANESEDGGSDSGGDSVFITQSAIPVAERSVRRRSHRQRSFRTSPRVLPEKDASSSHPSDELKTKIKRLTRNLPKYHFSFVHKQEPKRRSNCITYDLNDSLLRSAIRGFFRCAKELQECNAAPASVIDEMDLEPLSEEGEEGPGDKDIKVVERTCFVVGVKAKTSKTWWDQTKEARKVKVVKSRQQNKPKVKTSRLNPQSVDSNSSDDKGFGYPAKNTQLTKTDRKIPATGQLVQRCISKTLQQKAQEEETSHDSDATIIEQPEEESVSTPNSRGEPAESPIPTEADNIVKETLDGATEPPIYPTSHELQYNETSWVQGSFHDDTVVAQNERGTAEANQHNKNNKSTSLKIRRTLFQQKAQEVEMCDDSDATVCEPKEEESVCPPLGRDPSTSAEPPAQILCVDDQSQTEEEPESQSFLQPLPMSTIMHVVDNDSSGRKTEDGKKKKRKKAEESAEDEMVPRQEESEDCNLTNGLEMIEEMSSLLDKTTEPPACSTNDELECNDRSEIQGSCHDDTGVVQEDRSSHKTKPKKKKKEKSSAQNISPTRTLLQEKAQGEVCDDSDATVCELHDQERTSLSNNREDVSVAAEVLDQSQQEVREKTSECSSFLPNLPTSVIHDVNNDSLCKDRRKKKRKKGEESAEDETVQLQEEPEGPYIADVPNVVEETSHLLDNSSAKPKKKKKDKSTAQNSGTRTQIQENEQDDSNATVCELHDQERTSLSNNREDVSVAAEVREEKSECSSFLPNLLTSVIHDVNNDSPGRKTKDRKKKRRKKGEERAEEEIVGIQEEPEGPNLADVPNVVEETSSLLDNPAPKPKKKKKDRSTAQNIRTPTLIQENAHDDSNITAYEPNEEENASPPNDNYPSTAAEDHSLPGVTENEPESQHPLQPLPMSTFIHEVNRDSPGRKTKDRKKKKRKKGEESAEDETVQLQEEPEGPYIADVPNVVEETSHLLDNSSAKPKKKKKDKSTAQNSGTRTQIQENEQDDSNATVCELHDQERTSLSNNREDVSVAAEVREEKSECSSFLPNLLTSVIHDVNNDSPGRKTKDRKKKKRKKGEESTEDEVVQHQEEPEGPNLTDVPNVLKETSSLMNHATDSPLYQARDVLIYKERSLMQVSSSDGTEVAQLDIPDVRLKKKKHKSAAQARWVENGNSDADVRMEVSGLSLCCSDESGDQKRKKKKRKRDKDNEQLIFNPSDEPPDDGGLQLKKKKQKRGKVTTDERRESTNAALALERQNGSGSIWISRGVNDSIDAKKKEHKKETQLCSDTGAPDRENVQGMNFWLDPATSGEINESGVRKNKKGKAVCDEGATPEKSEQVLDNPQNIAEDPEGENVHKKKKKKRKDNLSKAASVESLVQSDDSVSASRKKKEKSLPLLLMSRKTMYKTHKDS